MTEIIALTILTFSFLGILAILFSKAQVLADLKVFEGASGGKSAIFKLKGEIKSFLHLNPLLLENFLQKFLSKVRIFTLKTENKTANWLQRLRERSQKKKEIKNDSYWEDIKNSTK